jgi:hypothetical protein
MIGTGELHCAGDRRRVWTALCALVLVVSLGAGTAYADDVSGEYTDDAPEQYADDVPEESADDILDEDADTAPEESADDGDEDVDEDSGPGFGRKAWDATLLRPLNFIRLTVGSVLMVPVSVLTLPAGVDNVLNMADYFVGQPYWDTFERPLGKF